MATTLTMAGLQATAGASRLRAVAPVSCPVAASVPSYGMRAHQVLHHLTTWIPGVFAGQAVTSMTFDRKNRPARHLSERSP